MIVRREAGQIMFMFDPTQCKRFPPQPRQWRAESTLGNSTAFRISESSRIIAHIVEPVAALLLAITGAFAWRAGVGLADWSGSIRTLGHSEVHFSGRQTAYCRPAFHIRDWTCCRFCFSRAGAWFCPLSDRNVRALPRQNFCMPFRYGFFRPHPGQLRTGQSCLFDASDDFNRKMGIPLMWHVGDTRWKAPAITNGYRPLIFDDLRPMQQRVPN